MLDIHVGVRRDELKPFKRIMDRQFLKRNKLSTMEDRWEDWGKQWPEDQTDPDDIIHVVISTDVPMSSINFIISVMQVFLDPITDEDSGFEGKLLVVTDHSSWNQVYHEFSYPE